MLNIYPFNLYIYTYIIGLFFIWLRHPSPWNARGCMSLLYLNLSTGPIDTQTLMYTHTTTEFCKVILHLATYEAVTQNRFYIQLTVMINVKKHSKWVLLVPHVWN